MLTPTPLPQIRLHQEAATNPIKRLALALSLMTIGAAPAVAAPVTGNVVGIDNYKVRIVVVRKLPSWVKKGTSVRFLDVKSYIVGVAADTVLIASMSAYETDVGAVVTFKRWRAGAAGC